MTLSPLTRFLCAGLICASALPAAPALAEGYRAGPPRPCAPAPCRRLPPPPAFGYGPPRIVSGYLPRNNNLPMYNEPPARPPAW
ncbi:hypothetical protein [Methylobacterium gregans]|uniref:Uncharacterized protein n=1 Tax=Methylobacterium gregans TaxID=374424 RepID=A0AA37HSQ8_9HYPH|nr:hypothetical protein [Methylobacterium gregans]MDQ0520858.1 hypothetical protein [Methylobacterium gregans]GJD81304.1 hypothetical protein NBEOAGPD_4550 [Methylobacterium gregans]GLS53194.1 hypothetical protein GCM10007886_13770 [Methylobacterium gregans]